jgi:hypothetical protein
MIIKRPHTYEMNAWAGLRIIAPHGYAAAGTAPEDLTLAAGAGKGGLGQLSLQELDLQRLDNGVNGKS